MVRKIFQSHIAVLFLAFLAIVALFILNAVATSELLVSRSWVEHTHQVIEKINAAEHGLEEAEKSRRGYLLTQDQRYFSMYTDAQQELLSNLDTLKTLTIDNRKQQARLQQLQAIVSQIFMQAQGSFAGSAGKLADVTANEALHAKAEALLHAIKQEEERLLSLRNTKSGKHLQVNEAYNLLLKLVVVALVALGIFFYFRENRKRKRVESGLVASQRLATSTVRNLTLLSEMSSLLQSAKDMDESFRIIAYFTERLLEVEAGALYLFRESRNQLEIKAAWGGILKSEAVFIPENCWALRRGHEHAYSPGGDSLPCLHVQAGEGAVTICQPITAQGSVQGIIYFQRAAGEEFTANERKLLINLSTQVALSLANMKLRETLRDQSVRDPLTGLFNRRYMEESLNQLFSHASRKQLSFGLAILDIDHFKHFNDTFGHEAGDVVMREVGGLLARSLRVSDIACRFGGEEFVLIFPDATLDVVNRRCDEIRLSIHALELRHMTQSLGKISISIGIAMYPAHGHTAETLMQAADKALYRAKENGRNRVEIAEIRQA